MNRTMIYFDHAATTPLLPQVRAAMEPFFEGVFGNPSSPYAVARESRMALDGARAYVARLIGAHADEIVWTSGGTESDNWALLGVAFSNISRGGHFVVSQIEHHALLDPAQSTLRELGFQVDFARPNRDGVVSPDEVARLLRPDTRLVSLMSVNNETGSVQPTFEVARLCAQHDVLFHVDATQSVGKLEIDVDCIGEQESFPIHLLTLSAHKIGGPKGVGALYIRRGTPFSSLLRGGAQERGRRAGTENVAGIVGFGVAARLARENLQVNRLHLDRLMGPLEAGVCELGARIIGVDSVRAPHICAFILPDIRAESVALRLDLAGIAVGTGSACASGALEPSHVLAAMGYSASESQSALRVSIGNQNQEREVESLLHQLRCLFKKLI